nr:hypothetical protein [Tanacetum cinerariifolium]
VADIRAIRILIAITAYYDYEIWQMDGKIAFLNGHLSEEVYMEQPEASGSYIAILILYVDDILLMGNNIPMLEDVKSYLGRSFAMKDLGEAAYILGIKIYRYRSKRLIGLCQKVYIEKILKSFYMENSKRGTIPMQEKLKLSKSQGASTPAEIQRMQNIPYASAIGFIMHVVRCTRPDVAFAQNMTSRFQQHPGEEHWTAVKNILKYLRTTKDMFLVYGGNMERELRVSCYTDAGYLTDADNLKSQTGYVFVLNRGAVDWKSTKQSIFATSSTDAEYIAAFDASKEAVWIRKFISGLGIVPTIEEPISMYCDNTGAIAIAKDNGVTKGVRHFRAKVHYLRETIKLGDVNIEKIDTNDNLADPFTKALAFPKHSELTRNIGLLPASSFIFVQNYNMHGMRKTMNELHAMLKLHEVTLPKKDANLALHAIRAGKVQKNQKNKSHKAGKGSHGKGKGKMGNASNNASFASKPKTPPPPKKDNPAKDAICHQCGEVGHWRRNCPVYLAELRKKKKLSQGASTSGIFIIELYSFPSKSWIYDTGCGTHICITTQGLRGSKKLKPGALSPYVGDGHRTAVEAIRTYHLELPSGLVIVLNNYHYAPSITRGVISVLRLFDDGFINRFDDNNVILVSKNNLVYFKAIPRDGIYEIDMSCSNTNDSSMYAITDKRAKINLDSSLLWHCRLGHISKKRIEKLQHEGLLNSIDIESLGKCVSCMSGKMARKPYSHQVEMAKDLLGLIHTDVCGPFKIMSRQGASYFVTFTIDFSRYGYVYLLKHKHEVFETFKVFQKEVENQLGKTIKSLRSDRGGEYISQEFVDHLKEYEIVSHRTPPYTPQHNRVSERRNQTLLDLDTQRKRWDILSTAHLRTNLVALVIGSAVASYVESCSLVAYSVVGILVICDADACAGTGAAKTPLQSLVKELASSLKHIMESYKVTTVFNKVNTACAQLVLLVYKVTTVFNKVNAASSKITTDDEVTTAGWIKTEMEVIVNGDSVTVVASASAECPIPLKTAKQKLARKNELKANSTLMLAIPDEHLLKFHACKDAKSLWEAIKNGFGGNKESKKMQKTILKQNYENFVESSQEGLDKNYDRFQKLISQLEIHSKVISQEDANQKLLRSLPSAWNNIALIMRNKYNLDILSMDNLYNNLKMYESEIKSQSISSSNSQNVAFISSDNTSNTNEIVNTAHGVSASSSKDQVSTASYADDVMFSFFFNQSNALQLDNDDLKQIDTDDLE